MLEIYIRRANLYSNLDSHEFVALYFFFIQFDTDIWREKKKYGCKHDSTTAKKPQQQQIRVTNIWNQNSEIYLRVRQMHASITTWYNPLRMDECLSMPIGLVLHILNTRRYYYALELSDFRLRKILARCVINSVIWTNAWAHTNGVWVFATFLHIHLLPPCIACMQTSSIVQYFQIAIECICFLLLWNYTTRAVCNSTTLVLLIQLRYIVDEYMERHCKVPYFISIDFWPIFDSHFENSVTHIMHIARSGHQNTPL